MNPSADKITKIPKFSSPDKGLEQALNLIMEMATSNRIPNVGIDGAGGTVDFSSQAVTIRPKIMPRAYSPATPWHPYYGWDDNGTQVVYFNLGTVNGVAPENHLEMHYVTDNQLYYVVLNIQFANGKLTRLVLDTETNPPKDTISKNTPPASIKFLLGMLNKGQPHMLYVDNITLVGKEVFRESRKPPSPGEEPYHRWYRWAVL